MSIASLIDQIGLELQQKSVQGIEAELDALTGQMTGWLNRAAAYIELENEKVLQKQQEGLFTANLIQLDSRASKNIETFVAQQALQQAKNEILDRNILFEGYELLNRIGESVRGDNINYSVTVTGSGDWEAGFGEAITWNVDYEVFKSLITTSRTRLLLSSPSSIMKQLNNQDNINSKFVWTESLKQEYIQFHEWAQVKRLLKTETGNVLIDNPHQEYYLNYGNTLEAFMLMKTGRMKPHDALIETLQSPIPFYKGGDIETTQIKGMNASVTNINTLINAMSQTLRNVNMIKAKLISLANKPPKIGSKAEARVNQALDRAIKRLLAQYGFS